MEATITTDLVKAPTRIALEDLEMNKRYYLLTDLNELSEFTYKGNSNIELPCGGQTFLVSTDQVFEIDG